MENHLLDLYEEQYFNNLGGVYGFYNCQREKKQTGVCLLHIRLRKLQIWSPIHLFLFCNLPAKRNM